VSWAAKDAPRRVHDPACGAGVFLVAMLRAAGATSVRARADIAAEMCGLDVDPTAIALGRLALALAILDGESPDAIDRDTLARAVSGVRVADAIDADLARGFDAVLGNPPWGQKRFAIDPARKAALRARFTAAAGRTDVAPAARSIATRNTPAPHAGSSTRRGASFAAHDTASATRCGGV
jgi:hypothetical protein